MDKEGASPDPSGASADPVSPEEKRGPGGELKPTLHGDLTQVNLPDIFQSLVMSQMEGTLQVNSKWKVTYIHHEAGQIRILLPEEDWLRRIGYRLLSSGLVEARDLKAALRTSHKEQVDLGQILIDEYGTDLEQFRAIRRALEEDAIFELFTQHRGNFLFYGDAYPDPDLERRFATCPNFEASQILLEVARKSDEWTIILKEIEDINEIMRPTQDAYREGVEVNEIEENLLNHLDGTRSLSDIAGGMLYCLFDVMKGAQTLLRRNLIEKVPTEDLFALTEADIHAEQEKRAVYYLNLVSTFRKPLPLDHLQYLAELQIRVNRPRDAGKTYADCAALAEDDETRLHYLYDAKRLDPRNPDTLIRLLDALALYLSNSPEEAGDKEGDAGEGGTGPSGTESTSDEDIHPELALGDTEEDVSSATKGPRRKNRSFADKQEDFRDLSVELADFLLHRDEADTALGIIDRLISFGFDELRIPVLKSKILCKLDKHAEATKVLVDASAAYRKEGRQKELTHCLEQALKLDPANSKLRNELRDLRSRFNRRVRRLSVAALVLVVGSLGAWQYYGSLQLAERAQSMIAEAKAQSRSPDPQQLAKALGILAEVRRMTGDTDLGDIAQKLTDQILEEKARRKQASIDKKDQDFDTLAKVARTSFLQGHYTKALHLYMSMATSKQHGGRAKFITELFLSQQDTLATELENEFNKLNTHPLPDVQNLRNLQEYKAAQVEIQKRFPIQRRRELQRFVETIRMGIFERHPFLAKKGTEPIPTLSSTLIGHDTVPERYEAVRKVLQGADGLPEDLTSRIRAMDMAELDRIGREAGQAGFVHGMSLVQEAGLLSSPAKTLYLDLLDYLVQLRDVLEQDPELVEIEWINKDLAKTLKTPPFSIPARLEGVEGEIGNLVARTKELRIRRENRTKALGKALSISNDSKITVEVRRKRLRSLGLPHSPEATARSSLERAGRYLSELKQILSGEPGSYAFRMKSLHEIQQNRDWVSMELEELDARDAELLALLYDETSERPVRAQRTSFALMVSGLQQDMEVRQAEVEERRATIQSFQALVEKLKDEATPLEDKLAACLEFQLRIEVLLLRDGGKIQEIEEARRIGNAGLLGRFMALLGKVEEIEIQLGAKLSTTSSIRVINDYFLKAQQAFREQRFQDSLKNYEQLLDGYRKLAPENRDAELLAEFEDEELKLRDICEGLAEIEAARKRGDHETALRRYRELDRDYYDVNFKQIVRLPLLISSVPSGAQIFVNGSSMGITPKTLAAPADTELRIEIRLVGFKTEVFEAKTSASSRFFRNLEIQENWAWNHGAAVTTPPTVDKKNRRLLVSDRRGNFRSIDLKTGEVVFSKRFNSLSGEYDLARIYGDRFLLASAEGLLRRFDLASGKEVGDAQKLGRALLLPSRKLGSDLLLTTKKGEILILNPAFTENPNPLMTLTGLRFPPVTDGRGRFMAATTDGKIRAWDKEGRLLWEQSGQVEGSGWHPITLRANYLLVPTDRHKLHCLDARSGRIRWTTILKDDVPQPATMDDKNVYLATTGNELVVLDLATGSAQTRVTRRLSNRPSGPLAIWGRFLMVPIKGAGIRFFDKENCEPTFHIGGGTTSEVTCNLVDKAFLYVSTKGDVRSYPTAPVPGLRQPVMLPARPK